MWPQDLRQLLTVLVHCSGGNRSVLLIGTVSHDTYAWESLSTFTPRLPHAGELDRQWVGCVDVDLEGLWNRAKNGLATGALTWLLLPCVIFICLDIYFSFLVMKTKSLPHPCHWPYRWVTYLWPQFWIWEMSAWGKLRNSWYKGEHTFKSQLHWFANNAV